MVVSWRLSALYDPNQDPAEVKIEQERLQDWLSKGAQPTTTVASLIKRLGKTTPAN
jgi:small subunit ribosomal protein S16